MCCAITFNTVVTLTMAWCLNTGLDDTSWSSAIQGFVGYREPGTSYLGSESAAGCHCHQSTGMALMTACRRVSRLLPGRLWVSVTGSEELFIVVWRLQRGRDLSGNGSISRDALEANRLMVSRSTLAKNLFLALDPKPYQVHHRSTRSFLALQQLPLPGVSGGGGGGGGLLWGRGLW